MDNALLLGDCREVLKTLPAESVHCVVTSPPYFGLRSYLPDGHPDKALEIGLEETPEAFVANLVEVFREVRRVLRGDGVAYVVIGDSYAGAGYSNHEKICGFNAAQISDGGKQKHSYGTGLKNKDRMMIPARVALALQADGWWLRDEIIWSKPNPMPSSVTDRTTGAHEMVYLLSKSARYWYDAEAVKEESTGHGGIHTFGKVGNENRNDAGRAKHKDDMPSRNRRSVWTVATQGYSEAHFATFPPKLIEPMILAGCPAQACAKCGKGWERVVEREKTWESGSGRSGNPIKGKQDLTASPTNSTPDIRKGPVVHSRTLGHRPACACAADSIPGTVLDPFFGSGTVGQVAERLGRRWIGIDLNDGYSALQQKRTAQRGLSL